MPGPFCRPAHRELVRGLAEQVKPVDDSFDPRLLRDFMLFTNDLDVSRAQSFSDVNSDLLALFAEAGFLWVHDTVHGRRREREGNGIPVSVVNRIGSSPA